MCGCSGKFKVGSQESLKGMPVIIQANDVAEYRTKDILLCIYSASPAKFKAAYAHIMVNGSPLSDEIESEKDIINLATVHDAGNDRKVFNADFLSIAQAIKHTQAELEQATCTIGLKQ